jgi:hypothetical protein
MQGHRQRGGCLKVKWGGNGRRPLGGRILYGSASDQRRQNSEPSNQSQTLGAGLCGSHESVLSTAGDKIRSSSTTMTQVNLSVLTRRAVSKRWNVCHPGCAASMNAHGSICEVVQRTTCNRSRRSFDYIGGRPRRIQVRRAPSDLMQIPRNKKNGHPRPGQPFGCVRW